VAQANYAQKNPPAAQVAPSPAWSRNPGQAGRHLALRGGDTATRSDPKLRPSQVPARPADLEFGHGVSSAENAVPRVFHSATTVSSGFAPPVVAETLASPGRPVTQAIQAELEYRFDHHFGDVRGHSDTARVATQVSTGAHAGHADTGALDPVEQSGDQGRRRGADLEAQATAAADRLVPRAGAPSAVANISRGSLAIPPQTDRGPAGGRPADAKVSAHVGRALGYDFSSVRIHDDQVAARLTDRLGAHAATFGGHIAFAAGRYRPDDVDGRRLLTHELVHVAQQRTTGPLVQLAAKDGPRLGSTALTLTWDIHFKQNLPTAAEMFAAPDVVLTPGGLSDYRSLLLLLTADPEQLAQIEGSASIEGNPAENDRLSARRAQWIANQIGPQRVRTAAGHVPDCRELIDGEYACGTSHARQVVDPADRRATVRLFRPAVPPEVKIIPPGPQPAPPQPPTATTSDTTKGEQAPDPTQGGTKAATQGGTALPDAASGSNQLSAQAGVGYTRHHYTTPAKGTDPLGEWVTQAVLAYTRQMHKDKQAGLELQFPLQVQYSLTTGQWTIGGGSQLSYVVPFGSEKQFQWSGFVQALAGPSVTVGPGRNVTVDSWLFQPALGTQLTWQPKDWLTISGQITGGSTTQTSGPSSLDVGGVFVITVQR
jgi:hypothetical protein